ncbi:MAG: gluconolactonase [Ruminococcaceae bacterium]|nr:gluconolactonase [Oscillospiraceae bacterium]
MKHIIKRTFTLLLALVLFLLSFPVQAGAVPYDSYNYDYWENVVQTPAPYVPDSVISGISLDIGAFSKPQDICVAPDGDLYIADTGNNRIVVVEENTLEVVRVIDSFDNSGAEDTFNAPTGVCVSENNQLYIADRENKRIVVLELDGTLVKIVENPQSDVLGDNFVFKPLKVSVDYADRIYCIAQNMFQGIMVFETEGQFSGFFGTINVNLSLWEKFWKKVATKEERENQTLYIATEFTGMDIDEDGFVYATNIDETGEQGVRRLNPRGEDVIKKGRNEHVGGDLWSGGSGAYAGPSQITDVVYRGHGIYSLLDRKRGRVFTYDHEGNLLYIFGGLGTQAGTFNTPSAIEQWNNQLLVLDATRNEIYCFAPTEYGSLINEAVALRHDGDEALAVELWQRVLELDENNELANTGIGKAYLSAGDNEMAMKYLKLGMNRDYYSVAFKRYRSEILRRYLGQVLTGAVVITAGIWVFLKIRERKEYSREGGSGK